MRRFSTICLFIVAFMILTLSLALAGGKFNNEDTAKNRKDNNFGTDAGDDTSTITFGTNDSGDSTMKSKARPKPEEVDWYDKVIITVNPNTNWGNSSTTTTTTGYNNATDVQTTTSTTTSSTTE